MLDHPGSWSGLCLVVFLLGMRHGFDADHLAAIDGITRLSHRARHWAFRFCGLLFSLGHGGVAVLTAGAVAWLAGRWSVPGWIDAAGAWISVGFLTVLGAVNLRAALRPADGAVLVGLKAAFLGRRAAPARTPWAAVAVGALFALSFDTLSQAALFALSAAEFGGVARALALGGLFMLGMLLVGGLNGFWMAHLLTRADAFAARAGRVMAFTVGAVSLLLGALGAARLLLPRVDHWTDGKEILLSAGVLLAITLCFFGMRSLKLGAPLRGRG